MRLVGAGFCGISGKGSRHGTQDIAGGASHPQRSMIFGIARGEDQAHQQADQHAGHHGKHAVTAQREDLPRRLLGIEQRHHGGE